jgi:NAD-dependent SIR2 family protein deacetylase
MGGLHDFLDRHRRLFVLSGAGASTASGIPGYRDGDGRWTRRPPVTWQEFARSPAARARYWARSMLGWPIVARAHPNAAHRALARLEAARPVTALVTQNVDGLHQRAGSCAVIELHGTVARVICLACRTRASRAAIQRTLEAENPGFASACAAAAPDGDADALLDGVEAFNVPRCAQCGGTLKPDVVFFGENVPPPRVAAAMRALEQADAMLVVGRTRADALFALKIDAPCAEALAAAVERLDASAAAG